MIYVFNLNHRWGPYEIETSKIPILTQYENNFLSNFNHIYGINQISQNHSIFNIGLYRKTYNCILPIF